MADDREIKSAIRMPGVKEDKRFTRGEVITDPDELEAAAKEGSIDLQALHDSGAITGGTWKGVTPSEEGEEKTTKKAGKKAKK